MKKIRVQRLGGLAVLLPDESGDFSPQKGKVLIQLKAAGVIPYDTYMRACNYGARAPQLSFTPGSDAAGIVQAVTEVRTLRPGDRVYTMGIVHGTYTS